MNALRFTKHRSPKGQVLPLCTKLSTVAMSLFTPADPARPPADSLLNSSCVQTLRTITGEMASKHLHSSTFLRYSSLFLSASYFNSLGMWLYSYRCAQAFLWLISNTRASISKVRLLRAEMLAEQSFMPFRYLSKGIF